MAERHRFQIALGAASGFAVLVACSALAFAQASNVECKKTETQAECHARLKCKADEELEDCQKRLLRCTADESLDQCKQRARGGSSNSNQNADDRGRASNNDRGGGDERDRGDRGGDDRGGRDRGDQGRDDRDDRDESDRSRGRGGRGGGGGGGRGRRSGGGGFEANKTFGLGLELGEPTGLNGKVFVSPAVALDFGLGYIYRHYYYGDGLNIYGDVLFHPVSLASTDALEVPVYIGGGLRFWDFDYCYMGVCDYGGSAIGIRVPIGVSFDFNHVPLDIFIQLVPVLDFVRGDYYVRYRDREHVGIDVSAGIRFWFK